MRFTHLSAIRTIPLVCLLLGLTDAAIADSNGMKYDPSASLTVDGFIRGFARTNLAGLCEVNECLDETLHSSGIIHLPVLRA